MSARAGGAIQSEATLPNLPAIAAAAPCACSPAAGTERRGSPPGKRGLEEGLCRTLYLPAGLLLTGVGAVPAVASPSQRALCLPPLPNTPPAKPERRCSSASCNIEGKQQTMVNPGSSSQPPPVTAGSLSWKRCAGCGGKIADRFLLYAMDSYWHSRCLKCSCCQAQLGDIGTSCYTKSGMILCRNDYIRLFGNSGACSACGQSIPASELVMRAQGNVYHLKCFTCSTCRNRLVPGDRFHYINGSLFCEHDRPTALINGHLNSLQSNPLLPDQKVC